MIAMVTRNSLQVHSVAWRHGESGMQICCGRSVCHLLVSEKDMTKIQHTGRKNTVLYSSMVHGSENRLPVFRTLTLTLGCFHCQYSPFEVHWSSSSAAMCWCLQWLPRPRLVVLAVPLVELDKAVQLLISVIGSQVFWDTSFIGEGIHRRCSIDIPSARV